MNRILTALGVTLCLASAAISAASLADSATARGLEPTLSVQGEAEVRVTADRVSFRLGVETSAEAADQALADNSRSMARVRQVLASAGLQPAEVKTGTFSIQPQWQPRPRQAAADWQPTIAGYQVVNYLEIETGQMEKIGDWIQLATEAGANALGTLQFSLSDPDRYRSEAIMLATRKARGYARSAAEAAEVKLAGISAIQVDGAALLPVSKQHSVGAEMATMRMADAAPAPQVTGGEIEVRASVSLQYHLAR